MANNRDQLRCEFQLYSLNPWKSQEMNVYDTQWAEQRENSVKGVFLYHLEAHVLPIYER